MSSNLKVNSIIPATGNNVAIGTAGGSITWNADTISGISSITDTVTVGSGSSTVTIGIGTVHTLDVRGEATFGEGMHKTNLNWSSDTYQKVYSFSGASGGNVNSSADGTILLANPNTNPSNTRVGTIVFGNNVVGTANTTANPGIKAGFEGRTNVNVPETANTKPDDTGGHLNVLVKPDGGNLRTVATFDSEGSLTIPNQPAFRASYNGNASIITSAARIPFTVHSDFGCFDKTNSYNNTNYMFVAPVAGTYIFGAGTYTNLNQDAMWDIRVNGTIVQRAEWRQSGSDDIGDNSIHHNNVVVQLAVNDQVDVYWSGGQVEVIGNYTSFHGAKIS
tara:strand:- start:1314 stop:2315 length:1002 start_codon:yes stop_codon:yes gene_type:complete